MSSRLGTVLILIGTGPITIVLHDRGFTAMQIFGMIIGITCISIAAALDMGERS